MTGHELPDPDCSTTRASDPFDTPATELRRRHALAVLRSYGALTLADLADEVAVREHGCPLPAIDPETVLDVYLSLYHDHVPALVNADAAVYDQERDLVAPRLALVS
ncbi:DUF7344 domain-containing protein [Halospeciosus flavus]|uniref:DUF7344 domain-containing protein n=1 Tax=Halospeciosus flavus TaxID=3032283 RepID=A0ABD5Z6J4_9EURY|nr:hypothetical protein [Halospeciosus flavus]